NLSLWPIYINGDEALLGDCTWTVESIPLEEVFEQLKTTRSGLTTDDVELRLTIFRPNKLEEKPVSIVSQLKSEMEKLQEEIKSQL
ncbi:hypothetical protein Droror1_Dr00023547, partial [Drosera rotundifolia]